MNYKAIIEAILFTMGESVELEKYLLRLIWTENRQKK